MDALLPSILTGLHVLLAVGLVTLILLQQGQGAGMGAAFGSGASGTVFGSRGSASFLTKTTAVLATVFFLNSIALAYLASHRGEGESSVLERVQQPGVQVPSVPEQGTPPAERPGEDDIPAVPGAPAQRNVPSGGGAAEGFSDDVPAVPGGGSAAGGNTGDVPAAPDTSGSRSE